MLQHQQGSKSGSRRGRKSGSRQNCSGIAQQSEWGKTLKSDVVVEQLMKASYEGRRDKILNGNGALRIDQLIVKYPCLQSSFHVSDCFVFSNFALVYLICK